MNRRMFTRRFVGLAGACAALLTLPAAAHHSFAMFDQRQIMTLRGTVTEFQWTNPHSFIELDVPQQGRTVHWSIELNSPNNLRRQGWRANSLRAGEQITLRMNPLRDGKKGGLFLDLEKTDGSTLDSGLPKNGTAVNVPQL